MGDHTVETLGCEVGRLERIVQTQSKQIATLVGFTGTLLGALESKDILQPDDVQVLVEIFQRIAPGARDRAVQGVLKAVVVAAEETPQMMTADTEALHPPQLGPLHASPER